MKRIFSILAAATVMTAAVSCSSGSKEPLTIIPYPNSVTMHSGSFNAAGADFHCSEGTSTMERKAVSEFASALAAASGTECNVTEGNSGSGFVFLADSTIADEAYELKVRKNKVTVKAGSYNGFLYAIETLKQMLPVEIYAGAPAPDKDWTLPCVTIKDAPRFAYRGQHLDVARHFFDVAEVKKVLDMMAIHKMNVLHWHLTDDQGWRVEIERYPELTEKGSVREGTVIGKDWDRYDNIPYGGYYTQDEIKAVIEYAAEKGITDTTLRTR